MPNRLKQIVKQKLIAEPARTKLTAHVFLSTKLSKACRQNSKHGEKDNSILLYWRHALESFVDAPQESFVRAESRTTVRHKKWKLKASVYHVQTAVTMGSILPLLLNQEHCVYNFWQKTVKNNTGQNDETAVLSIAAQFFETI